MHRAHVEQLLEQARAGARVKLRVEYYWELELEYHGPLPRPCHFCSEAVTQPFGLSTWMAVVHHLDHDRLHNTAENLVLAHSGCHSRYHASQPRRSGPLTDAHRRAIGDGVRGTVHSAESRANMSRAAKMRYDNPDQRAATSDALRGRPKSDEHRARLSAVLSEKSVCSGCGKSFNRTWMGRHKCDGR
jgi:hypothetical protein